MGKIKIGTGFTTIFFQILFDDGQFRFNAGSINDLDDAAAESAGVTLVEVDVAGSSVSCQNNLFSLQEQ